MAMAWSGPESGILRKTVPTGNIDELLVFGYACKLFRDDEKALVIDQGKHLIPWMGDVKLKIDRYDCRGHLSDIAKYEASREGYDAMRWLGLSDKERQLEELCDKERYYSLEINEEEEEMYKEEENKRKQTNAIAYSYDVPTNPNAKPLEESEEGAEEADEEYKPPPILDVPVDIDKPKTVKENAIIEKTALFVCRQGPQMEILIKAKQGDNPQFSFLNQGDRLNKFYRHVLSAFKSGIYKGYDSMNVQNSESSTEMQEQDQNSHYLHPSLLSANVPSDTSTAVTIPQVPYKPSVNCSYSQLVSRIQGNQNDGQDIKEVPEQPKDYSQMTYEQQQYYQYYYMQQYYEYCKQLALYQQGQTGDSGQQVDFENLDPNMQAYIQQMAYAQYVQHFQQQSSNNSYAQIVSNVNKEGNPYTAQVPQLPLIIAGQTETKEEQKPTVISDKSEIIVHKPLLSLAAYGSGSDSESESAEEAEEKEVEEKKKVYQIPNGETQAVIDKMAIYVSKNGEQFEEIVKAKGDARFSFLHEGHEFYIYYKEKIKELKGLTKQHSPKTKRNRDTDDVKVAKKEKKVIAPVSFSIKKAKDDPPKEIKSALPLEESDEEDASDEQVAPPVVPAPVTLVASVTRQPESKRTTDDDPETTNKEDDGKKIATTSVEEKTKEEIAGNRLNEVKNNKESLNERSEENSPRKNGILDPDDPILEMIELSDDTEDKRDAKRAEDRIKDKLATAAREKMSRDRALQLERRRRAAAFLKLKSVETATPVTDNTIEKCRSPLRRDSVEVILDTSDEKDCPRTNSGTSRSKSKSPNKKHKERSRSRYRSSSKEINMKRARSTDSERSRSRDRERKREKIRKKKSKKERRSSPEEGEYVSKKHEDGKEKKKKSHKRKHSKNKKKSKKRRRRSSESGTDSDTS